MFLSTQDDWQKALASGDVEKYQRFLKNINLTVNNNPLEAMDHGFIPESDGIAAVDLEKRLTSNLPHIAYMVSRWQKGFGGFAKLCEYGTREDVQRMYSVAYVIRPRTKDKSACLCFSLMSMLPLGSHGMETLI